MIIEYKLIKTDRGVHAPAWVEDGGYFYNQADKTMIGYTPDEANRDYYVPDSVLTLTEQQAIDRSLAIHAVTPYKNADGVDMSIAEVSAMVSTWYREREV